MPVSRGNENDVAFCGFDEYAVIEGFFLEENMCNAFDYFIQFRVSDSCGIFGIIMLFCFHKLAAGICGRNGGDIVPDGM